MKYSKHRFNRSGQASIELAAAIVLIIIIVTGIVHVSLMARTSLFLQSVLRGKAGEDAMNPSAVSSTVEYISNWEAGNDKIKYTADDQPIKNSVNLSATFASLIQHSVNSPDDWQYVSDHTQLPVSMVRLQNSSFLSTAVELTHEKERLYVPVDPFIKDLVYGKKDVAIEEEVWMPLMGGLF